MLGMSTGVILFSHGSLMCGAEQALEALARRIHAFGDVAIVEVGFLNYSAPTFEEAFRRCVAAGVSEIVVVPYFLVAGKFVTFDLPPRIEAAGRLYPEIAVRVTDALRFHARLADALVACAGRAAPIGEWRRASRAANRFCRSAPNCPAYGSPVCVAGITDEHA